MNRLKGSPIGEFSLKIEVVRPYEINAKKQQ
jgi:hypothetical protein